VKSNHEWIEWGKRDPLFGVATWPGHERGGSQAWTDDAFYELGRSDWATFLARWVVYGVDTSTCVEIGSGAGRLTKFMATTFDHVHAIDVSADMLDYARRNIDADNVTLTVTNGLELPLPAGSVTAAFSTHVFQHFNSPNDGAKYFGELARILGHKGSIMIHLPVHVFPAGRTAMRLLYATRKKLGDLRSACKRLASSLGVSEPLMRGLSYEMQWIVDVLGGLGFTDIEFVFFPATADGGLHSFVFARNG
jgi:SAM-dependent methyltransferase